MSSPVKYIRGEKINLFIVLLMMSLLCAMASHYSENGLLRIASYVSECLLIAYTFFYSKNNIVLSGPIVIVSAILLGNYFLSPYEHSYVDLLKYLGYYGCYCYGVTLAKRGVSLVVNRKVLYLFVLTPAFVVALFDHSVFKDSFFYNSNTFVYVGLSMGLIYTLLNYGKHRSYLIAWLIVAFYVLICTSLGVIVAIFIAYLVLNFKRSHLPFLLFGTAVFCIAIFYIDLPVFVRFRDVLTVWGSMTASDWTNIQDVNLYELKMNSEIVGERADTASSIWRLMHWTGIISEYVKQIWSIPFGLGLGYTINHFRLLPHSDIVLILTEYGIIIFSYFTSIIVAVYKKMRNEGVLIYFLLSMFFYHMTENLIGTFPPNATLYFVVGWCLYKFSKGK